MKKFLIVTLAILMVVLSVVSLCACSYVPSTRFMSRTQVKSLVKEFGTPQAELTLNYKVGSNDVEVKIVYNLLLGQTPLATIRFIQLANEGFYDDTVADIYNSDYRYVVMGRYAYRESAKQGKSVYYQNVSDVEIKGEFKSNNYSEPAEGYAQFSPLALAMYHDDAETDIANADKASGAIIMTLSKETLNADNYAVFAEMVSVTIKNNDSDPITYTGMPNQLRDNLASFTSKTSRTVYDNEDEDSSKSISIMSTQVKIHVKIITNKDWSKLPTIG